MFVMILQTLQAESMLPAGRWLPALNAAHVVRDSALRMILNACLLAIAGSWISCLPHSSFLWQLHRSRV